MEYLLPFGKAHGDQAWRCGPKAARLSQLSEAGFSIPPGFAIPNDAFEHFLSVNDCTEDVAKMVSEIDARTPSDLAEWPKRLRALVVAGQMPDEVCAALRVGMESLGGDPVALRSSSTMEDRADVSFAGQHDSLLNLRSLEACVEGLKSVWASLYSDRAMRYLRALDRSAQSLRMGVIMQSMVPAQVAGVAFTVHPLSGDYEQIYISAVRGLGEGAVSGAVAADEVIVSRDDHAVISYAAGGQTEQVVGAADGGTQVVAVEGASRAIEEEQARRVAQLALGVEDALGGDPQDVEWALVDDKLFLLQARPLVQKRDGIEVEWKTPIPNARWRRNWRLGEWLPEAVTPLFGSWILPKLVAAREQFGTGRLGWEHRRTFSMPHPWFCLVNGYFYTRQDFPQWGEKEGDAKKSEEEKRLDRIRQMEESKTHLRRWHGELLPEYIEHAARHRRRDVAQSSARALFEWVETLAEEAGEIWYIIAPIGYGFEEMSFRPHYEEKIPEAGRAHFSVLFSGYPSRIFEGQQALYELAQRVRNDVGLIGLLEGPMPLEKSPHWLREGVLTYVREYGHQLTSIDFFWPTSGEDINGLCRLLASLARRTLISPQEQRQRAAGRRDLAVERVLGQVEEAEHEMMAALIDHYQTNASVREDANFYLQYGWPLMRSAVLELSKRMVERGIIGDVESIFFLEHEELRGALDALDGNAHMGSLQPVADGRRRTWEEWRRLDAPDVLGTVEERDTERGYFDDERGRRIVAQGVSPGVHRGRVRFVQIDEPMDRFEEGDVLVTHAASPHLTPLMLMAGALVVEIGGGASHSSLVARELGLPAVVNAAEAMRVLKEGMEVEVDGTSGTVLLVED